MVFAPSSTVQTVLPAVLAAMAVTALLSRKWASSQLEKLKRSNEKPLREPVSLPKTHYVVGDLLEYLANSTRFHDWLADTSLHYSGAPWRMRIPGQLDTVVFTTPDAFQDVLVAQFDNFIRGESASTILREVFGRAILTFDGAEWSHQRKTAAKFFTGKALRACMLHTMRKNVHQVYDALDKHIASGERVTLSELLGQFTLQTFTEIGLGVDLRWIGKPNDHPLAAIAEVASPATLRRYRVPCFWWKLERYLNVGPEKRLADTMDAVRTWLSGLTAQTLDAVATRQAQREEAAHGNGMASPTSGGEEPAVKSVVELFVESSEEGKAGLRPDDLTDFLLTFIFGAQETSSTVLTRLFFLLTQHPQIERRLRDEMATVLPTLGVTKDTYLTSEHIHRLVYLDATIREVLRLYPAVPLVQREVVSDTVVCGDVPLRVGDRACLSIYAMARNPDVWGPDAAAFNPDRMVDPHSGELLAFPASKFASFSAGPRVCIGMRLGMLELRVVAANLLRRYRFELAAPNDGSHNSGLTLLMRHPLLVNVSQADADE